MDDILVPIVMFGSIPFIVWAVSHYRAKARQHAATVMQAVVTQGETLTPDIIKALGARPVRPHSDLRIGIILIAVAAATILFGGIVPEGEAGRIMGGVAMFPLLIGIAYIGFWIFIGRKAASDDF